MHEPDAPGTSPARPPLTDPSRRRELAGIVLIALGIVVLVWSVLYMTSASLGTSVRHGFAERRTYNETKLAVHEAIPGLVWRAMLGLFLVVLGGRVRASQRGAEGLENRAHLE